MAAFDHHLLVCTQEKPDGVPACSASGGREVLEALRERIAAAGLMERTLVTGCGCLGLCDKGPNLLIHPQGRWYTSVSVDDLDAIVEQELKQGTGWEAGKTLSDDEVRQDVNAHRAKVRNILGARARAGVLPDELNALTAGFRAPRALLTAVELDVFTAIGEGANAELVAERSATDRRAMTALLRVLVSFGLVLRRGDQFVNGPVANGYLREGAEHDARSAIMHSAHLWHRWSELTECVRNGTSASGSGQRDADALRAFIAAMHKIAALRAPMVVQRLDLEGVERVLDVGGGSGAYSIAFARAKAGLRATVFDLPEVLPLTRVNVEAAGLSDRITLTGGHFLRDDLGSDHDLALLSAICHMLGPEQNVELLRRVAGALRPGGQVIIQDFLLDDEGGGHRTATLFALNMLVNTENGSSYTRAEYRDWLAQAGLSEPRPIELAGPTGLLVATKV